ncbi:CCA tRNA nucleotidyltransferase [Fusibacter sp. 3D3]|uniref:CCA tRNA nucleotidyltransferase n=1 Tax=Fusibacter sp. 3D3 TaxID=1048380 RepID=UPI000852A436|nr:CCA tRNA nucleotidyltransferase [Fusibacter sp. 3D3]GAU76981.1 tRNA nucleotidyltransferase, A-adding [Fusibacter sp. 3D3]
MTACELLKLLLNYQKQSSTQIYLVGGFIRDLLLNRRSTDLDFTFQGDIVPLYEFIQKSHDAVLCSEFQTMRFESTDHIHFDIATMRREIYNLALERYEYEPSTLKWDIVRRDFTINTAYVKLNETLYQVLMQSLEANQITPRAIQYLKTHVCACHPLFYTDLSKGILRVLHSKSFEEDPSRIFRTVKIKNQLGFQVEEATLKALLAGINSDSISKLSLSRIQMEFSKLFIDSKWQVNLETLIAYKWQIIKSSEIIVTPCNSSEVKRIVLMSRFENHMDWLYGVDEQIKKCHEEYNRTLEAFSLNSEINDYNLYKLLYNKRIETINLMAKQHKTLMMRYGGLMCFKLNLTGNDLIQIGIPQNHQMRVLMDALLAHKLNHRIELSLEDEIKYIESIKNEY